MFALLTKFQRLVGESGSPESLCKPIKIIIIGTRFGYKRPI